MKKLVIGLALSTLVLIGGCITKPTSKAPQNVPSQNLQTGTNLEEQTGNQGGTLTGEDATSQNLESDSPTSTVSPEEEKLIEDILNSILE